MAIKDNELYSSLLSSCDPIRDSMDLSHIKGYMLVLLFIKYISDKYTGSPDALIKVPVGSRFSDLVALKGTPNIGDSINKKIIKPLTDENNLPCMPDFNDSQRLGRGEEMVDRLTKLIAIFENEVFDFSDSSKAESIIEIFDFLVQHFADLSGKSYDELATPKGVGKLLAKLVLSGKDVKQNISVYDPACGAASLLCRVAKEAGGQADLYGEEVNGETITLATLRLILDGRLPKISRSDVLSSPGFVDNGKLKKFDYIVSNPPFSVRQWSSDFEPANDVYGRFSFGVPPKNIGDFAFIQHMIASLKDDGRIVTLTTMGVLFRSGAEGEIRKNLIDADLIEAIIGLPSNLLPYTSIPTCILVLNKNKQADRKDKILFINASNEFVQEKRQNKLQSEHVEKIFDAFLSFQDEDLFSKVFSLSEIRDNKYNLNISRYVDNSEIGALVRQYYGNFSKSSLSDVALEINSIPQSKNFSEEPNAIYIARIGKLFVATDLEHLKGRHSNYHQVVLCPEKVLNVYLMHFFESDIGQHVLHGLSNTSVAPMITREGLNDCLLALPSLDDQKKNIEVHRKLSQLEESIRTIKGELTSNPVLPTDFADQLDRMLGAATQLTEADKIRSLIRKGESKILEFKETFSLCMREQKKADYVEVSALKTIVAFLNSDGGVLLVGVNDDERVTGLDIELEKFHKNSSDKFLLHFKNKLKKRVGADFYPFINYELIDVGGFKVFKCVCTQSTEPCFLDGKDFYVRTNPATDKLEGVQQWQYMNKRFQQQTHEIQGVPLVKAEW